jgi:hypothetical protein
MIPNARLIIAGGHRFEKENDVDGIYTLFSHNLLMMSR